MREGEAVLARNVMGDSTLGSRDSKGEILATSVICAPVRRGRQDVRPDPPLFAPNADRVPDPDDLEFTLAVADTVAVALENLNRQQELAENLTQVRTENVAAPRAAGRAERDHRPQPGDPARSPRRSPGPPPASATVLIRGESGVGKELVARAVHYSSPRRKDVFVCLNCAALSEDLLASELFGHERGAFTGATERKIGKFEAADNGTLMLDEIGEMSPSIQAKFLRVLEGHPFERVGGSKPVSVDVRVIAATNRDLEKDVAEGRFRRDLYFRLRVLEIVVPALRKRPEDIVQLANHFLEKFNAETGPQDPRLHPRRHAATARLPLAGQRPRAEERRRAGGGPLPRRDDRPGGPAAHEALHGRRHRPSTAAVQPESFLPVSLDDIERQHILATLNHTGWNKSRAAILLGIERSTLDRKIRRYGLVEEPGPRRPESETA